MQDASTSSLLPSVEYCRECCVELTAFDDDYDDLCSECAAETHLEPVREDLAA